MLLSKNRTDKNASRYKDRTGKGAPEQRQVWSCFGSPVYLCPHILFPLRHPFQTKSIFLYKEYGRRCHLLLNKRQHHLPLFCLTNLALSSLSTFFHHNVSSYPFLPPVILIINFYYCPIIHPFIFLNIDHYTTMVETQIFVLYFNFLLLLL
jgi:hypothetical protein